MSADSDRSSRFDIVDANGARWEMREGTRIVLTFGTHDRRYHLVRYRPFTWHPHEVMCGRHVGHLTTSADVRQWAVRTHVCYACEALGREAVDDEVRLERAERAADALARRSAARIRSGASCP